jgi:hypothetical protein
MAFTFEGLGTKVYGRRDYWPDGSFITTEWFVIAYVPLIPICSKRISYKDENPFAKRDFSGYYVYETLGVDRKQAGFIYGWVASVVTAIVGWNYFQDALARMPGDGDRAAGAVGITIVVRVDEIQESTHRRRDCGDGNSWRGHLGTLHKQVHLSEARRDDRYRTEHVHTEFNTSPSSTT